MPRVSRTVFLAAALAGLACTKDFEPTDVVGTYVATTFTYQDSNAAPVDILAAGGSMTLVLNADMSTDGSFVYPGVAGVPFPVQSVSMAGTYRFGDGNVFLDQTADNSFVRDLIFAFDGSSLRASLVAATSSITTSTLKLVLTKQ